MRTGFTQIADGTWAFMRPPGSWGETNTGLIVSDGAASMVIDTVWDTAWADRVAADTAPLVAHAPITEAVNTHADGDHWWGNDTLPATARITTSSASLHEMHEGVPPKQLTALASLGGAIGWVPGPVGAVGSYMSTVRGGARFPRELPRLPDHTFEIEDTIDVAGRTVALRHFGPAHTAGDLIAHVPDVGVVFSGDLLFIGSTPVLWHGPLGNWIDALDHLLALDADVYVPGHGPVCGKPEIESLRSYWSWVAAAGKDSFDAGLDAADAARNMMKSAEFTPFAQWDSSERLVLSLSTLYRLWRGEKPEPPTLARRLSAFADAGKMVRDFGSR